MIRTLYWYISRELLKTTFLALVALTLLMTVFAIVEPMRKEGLAPNQVTQLFIYTVPVMLSLTLPIAALFATTIVLGRFSQDNEMIACRASGISTITILRPALSLGVLVTVVSLLISNYISPEMVKRAKVAVKANVLGIVSQRLKTRGYVHEGPYAVRADAAVQEGDTLALRGVVASDGSKETDIRLVAASTAYAHFDTVLGETFLTIYLVNPVITQTGSPYVAQETSHPWESFSLGRPLKEDPSWYDWRQLVDTLEHPENNEDIGRLLARVSRDICHELLCREITEAINGGGSYDGLRQGDVTYRIQAGRATMEGDTVRFQSAPGPDGRPQPVQVTMLRDGTPMRVVASDAGSVKAAWLAWSDASFATLQLTGPVEVRRAGPGETGHRREQWVVGQLAIPPHITAAVSGAKDVYENLGHLSAVQKNRDELDHQIQRLRGEIIAEMNGRIAYGLSCFLLVAMGAALGLIFRGGEFISAFALSAIPATIVIVLVVMGKQMMNNPDVNPTWGLVAIWSGIVALLVANGAIYSCLVRR